MLRITISFVVVILFIIAVALAVGLGNTVGGGLTEWNVR